MAIAQKAFSRTIWLKEEIFYRLCVQICVAEQHKSNIETAKFSHYCSLSLSPFGIVGRGMKSSWSGVIMEVPEVLQKNLH
jgi:hypothetical protein